MSERIQPNIGRVKCLDHDCKGYACRCVIAQLDGYIKRVDSLRCDLWESNGHKHDCQCGLADELDGAVPMWKGAAL